MFQNQFGYDCIAVVVVVAIIVVPLAAAVVAVVCVRVVVVCSCLRRCRLNVKSENTTTQCFLF